MAGNFRRRLDYFLIAGVGAFLISFTVASVQWYRVNEGLLESTFFPASKDYTFVDWQQDTWGRWSAEVWLNKVRPECAYVRGQIETVIGNLPDGSIDESTITFIGDDTPGSTRTPGWQRLDDRVRIDKISFTEGTVFRGSVLSQCHSGNPTVTTFGPFTVGVDSPFPKYAKN